MAGDITEDHDHGSVWQLIYCDDDGREQLLHFEHRPFSYFYKSATRRNFTRMTGVGRVERIAAELVGRPVHDPEYAPVVKRED